MSSIQHRKEMEGIRRPTVGSPRITDLENQDGFSKRMQGFLEVCLQAQRKTDRLDGVLRHVER